MVVLKPFSSPYSNILVLNIFFGFQANPVSCLVIRGSTGGFLSLISVARCNNTLTIHFCRYILKPYVFFAETLSLVYHRFYLWFVCFLMGLKPSC